MAKNKQKQNTNWKGIVVLVEPNQLPILDERLRSYGFKTLEDLVKDLISGKFPPQIDNERQALDADYLKAKIRKVMALTGMPGLAAKIALLAGLRAEELLYIHRAEICSIQDCECSRLHIVDRDGLVVVIVNWFRDGKKCYFALMPTRLWQCFRDLVSFDLADVENARAIVKQSAGIDFEQLRKIFLQVMSGTMEAGKVKILDGRAGFEAARDCRFRLDSIAEKYCKAWEKFDLILPVI